MRLLSYIRVDSEHAVVYISPPTRPQMMGLIRDTEVAEEVQFLENRETTILQKFYALRVTLKSPP